MKSWFSLLTKSFFIAKERSVTARVVNTLTPFERILIGVLLFAFVFSSLMLLQRVNAAFLEEAPAYGGSFTEGIVGSPRFVNPLLATSDADRDLVMLTFAGLMRATPEGNLIPDLAESYTISDDGLEYHFTIRENAVFHDGTPVTTEDVVFTVRTAQDPLLKSPKRASWEGVFVEEVSEREVRFVLLEPYAPFLENTSLGILPKHVWEDVTIDQFPFSNRNINPIGAGPYRVSGMKRDDSGVPSRYTLTSFGRFSLGAPFIRKIIIRFYSNEENVLKAYSRGEIDAVSSVSPHLLETLDDDLNILTTPLPRIFAVFFNQNQAPILAEQEVREALALSVDRDRIVNSVLAGYGSSIDSPFPPGIVGNSDSIVKASQEEIDDILTGAGYERGEDGVWQSDESRLSFSLATANTSELRAVAEIVEENWEEAGFEVNLQIFEPGILNQNVIRPRSYDALLFGEIIGRELDLYAFWHSSQRNDPGLNIALYANITADGVLEEARVTEDRNERIGKYAEFLAEISNDVPAAFLYAPDFVYIFPESITGAELGTITIPGERFLNVHEWHKETEYIWQIFIR